jgi:monothiol glutaredoxin
VNETLSLHSEEVVMAAPSLLRAIALVCAAAGCAAFQPAAARLAASRVVQQQRSSPSVRMDAEPGSGWAQAGAEDANQRIKRMITENKIMVFMKGSKLMPQCGFSNAVVQVFNSMKVPFTTFDVLSDADIRQGIKEFSAWPTIPQVYVEGEFIGGCDIVVEMYQKGELQELAARVAAE